MTTLETKLDELIRKGIADRLFPACAIGAITKDGRVTACGGTFTYEDSRPIKPDSIFDVASLTKSIPTTTLALKLIEDGRLGLHEDIGQYLPQYQSPKGDKISVWNLLTQTVYYDFGFRLSSLRHKPAAQILQAIFDAPARTSKTKVDYTNSSSILLGLIIEKIYGKSLAEAGAEIFFRPLGMARTGFEPLQVASQDEIVPTEIDEGRGGLVHGQVHDESAHSLLPSPVGAAGLFSTAPDLLVFMEMLVNSGEYDGRRYLSAKTVKSMSQNQLTGAESAGLGWELNQPRFMGRFAEHSFGKTGFTGCLFLCNPELGAGLVILSNHIHPKRPGSFGPINSFRAQAADLVFGAA